MYRIPTIEEIYNEYHKQKFFAMNNVYPKTIKNYDRILSDPKKTEFLLKFQNMIKRNINSIDWKLYILACASLLKGRFELKILGSLAGNKLYRNYINYILTEEQQYQYIYDEIIRSIKFLGFYLKENNLNMDDYIIADISTIPLVLKHIYSGTISIYFYAAINLYKVYSWFNYYSEDAFQELFKMNKNEFINNLLEAKRNEIIKYPKIRAICDKLDIRFNS